MNVLTLAGIVIVLFWIYVFWLREYLDAHLQGTAYAWWHEKVEDVLWDKSRSILASRLYWVGGAFVAIHDFLATQGFDWTPLTTEIMNLIPERYAQYRPLALGIFLMLTGILFEWLRKVTTGPVGTSLPEA